MNKQFLTVLLIMVSGMAFSQEVPSAVIDQCQSNADADDLPECLGEGAVGYVLLSRVITDDYFGAGAIPVVEICKEQNDTYASSWTCVVEAAEKAVETASLIGRDAISDSCIRTLADSEVVERLGIARQNLRAFYRPSSSFYGGSIYYPFKGCS